MRHETRTVAIGEHLGPIDWAYDFASHGAGAGGAIESKYLDKCVERLRTLDEGIERGERWEATTDGGVPRCGWGEVIEIGMYDGWPYWRPVPSVLIASFLGGGEWTSFCGLSDIRKRPA